MPTPSSAIRERAALYVALIESDLVLMGEIGLDRVTPLLQIVVARLRFLEGTYGAAALFTDGDALDRYSTALQAYRELDS